MSPRYPYIIASHVFHRHITHTCAYTRLLLQYIVAQSDSGSKEFPDTYISLIKAAFKVSRFITCFTRLARATFGNLLPRRRATAAEEKFYKSGGLYFIDGTGSMMILEPHKRGANEFIYESNIRLYLFIYSREALVSAGKVI